MVEWKRLWNRIRRFKVNTMNYDVFLQICAVLLVLVHLVLMFVLWLGGVTFLWRLNIVSIVTYVVAFYFAGKKRVRLVYYMFVIEILSYSFVSVYLIGAGS